jgi:hypothetical protein
MKPAHIAALVLLGAGVHGCFYTHGNVNLRSFGDGAISFEREPVGVPGAQQLGRVRASARGYLLSSCSDVADRAVERLIAATRERGGNRVAEFRFRGHWTSLQEPVCRRNWKYLWLLVPAFLPVPTSATVSGVAIYDPRAGEVSVPESE